MPARKRKIRHDEETRARIQVAMILNRLHNHLSGKLKLSPTQVSCAKILLAKVLPDLSSVEMKAEVTTKPPTLEELYAGQIADSLQQPNAKSRTH